MALGFIDCDTYSSSKAVFDFIAPLVTEPMVIRPRLRMAKTGSSNAAREGAEVMDDMAIVEIKAFLPARDFALSKQFYQDLGFILAWSSEGLAYFRHGDSSFLLQNFYNKDHANNFMMHLLVKNVEAWWRHVQSQDLAAKYGVMTEPPADRSWGIRDFVLNDPAGVLWRIGENIEETESTHQH
jgi:catechol 2,3-dioxygenase-like lactoylglutathione lyase family enzyme